MTQAFSQRYQLLVEKAERALAPHLEVPVLPEARLMEAMAYSLSAGGKRFRPVLVFAVGEMLDVPQDILIPYACALEMIHTYSLIHDDLPAMDNDDMRRGRPTNHKVFGEAMAILAGDALLNRAYEVLFDAVAGSEGEAGTHRFRRVEAAALVAKAAGAEGMIGGQVMDILSVTEASALSGTTGSFAQWRPLLERMHAMKTGALIHASVLAPAILSGMSGERKDALARYAEQLGLSFQIRDDLLDVQGSEADLGKPVGSDEKNGKGTFVSLLGQEQAQQALEAATKSAVAALAPFGQKAVFLSELAWFVAERTK